MVIIPMKSCESLTQYYWLYVFMHKNMSNFYLRILCILRPVNPWHCLCSHIFVNIVHSTLNDCWLLLMLLLYGYIKYIKHVMKEMYT